MANKGHPDAMFISEMGLRKLLDVGSGLNAHNEPHQIFIFQYVGKSEASTKIFIYIQSSTLYGHHGC